MLCNLCIVPAADECPSQTVAVGEIASGAAGEVLIPLFLHLLLLKYHLV